MILTTEEEGFHFLTVSNLALRMKDLGSVGERRSL